MLTGELMRGQAHSERKEQNHGYCFQQGQIGREALYARGGLPIEFWGGQCWDVVWVFHRDAMHIALLVDISRLSDSTISNSFYH